MNHEIKSTVGTQPTWAYLILGQVWGYTRKSTREEGGTNKSQDSQGDAIVENCAYLGLPFSGDYLLHEQKGLSGGFWWDGGGATGVEGDEAARKRTRPKLTQLVKAIVSGECKAVVVWGLDRLARHVGIMETLIELMARHECLLFDRNGQVDISTPEGRNSVRATMTAAQYQRERAAVDAPRGIKSQRGKGKLVTTGNRVGYRSVGKATGRVLSVPEELKTVHRIFELFVLGTRERGPLSVYQIADLLMQQGVRWMEDVGQYARRHVRETGVFIIHPASIYAILQDCAYQGRQRHGKQEWDCPAFLVDGEPAVPVWLYEDAQRKLAKSKQSHPKHKSRPFSGKVKCGICGITMRMTTTSCRRADGSTTEVPCILRGGERVGHSRKCDHEELPVIHLPVLLDYTREHLAPLLIAELTARFQAGDHVDIANQRAAVVRELQEAERYLREELPKFRKEVSPEMLGAMERDTRQEIETLKCRQRDLDDKVLHMQRLRSSLADFMSAPEAVQREVIDNVFQWVAVIPSTNDSSDPDRGRMVFLTIWGTYHSAFIYREPKAPSSRFHNYHELRPATIDEAVGGVWEFPAPEAFVMHLERSCQAARVAFDIETVAPGFCEWKRGGSKLPTFEIA